MGAWDFGSMGLWEHEALGAWGFGSIGLLEHGTLGAWDFGSISAPVNPLLPILIPFCSLFEINMKHLTQLCANYVLVLKKINQGKYVNKLG